LRGALLGRHLSRLHGAWSCHFVKEHGPHLLRLGPPRVVQIDLDVAGAGLSARPLDRLVHLGDAGRFLRIRTHVKDATVASGRQALELNARRLGAAFEFPPFLRSRRRDGRRQLLAVHVVWHRQAQPPAPLVTRRLDEVPTKRAAAVPVRMAGLDESRRFHCVPTDHSGGPRD
jgi:hypothetical protein